MKKLHSILVTASAAGLLLTTACTKQIDDAYLNPNAETVQPVELLFPNLISNMTASYTANGTGYGTMNDGILTGHYIQFWGRNTANYQYDVMGGAVGGSDQMGSIWAMHYYGMGQNLNRVVQWGTEQQKWDYVGGAKALRAWSYLMLTTSYSDAGLDEEFNTSQLTFGYNPQPDFYVAVRKTAHEAIELLSRTGGAMSQANFALGDKYFYNGDVNKWKKFTYGVLARSFNHLTNKAEYNADSVIFYANLAINDNADNAYVTVLNEGNSATQSYYGPFRGNLTTQRQSKFIADLMNGDNPSLPAPDPRIGYLLRLNPNGTYRGVEPGNGSSGLVVDDRPQNFWGNSFTSTTGSNDNAKYIFKNDMPWPIMTASEIKFIKAEAYYRKGDKANALTAYKEGIQASMDMLTDVYPESIDPADVMTPAIKAAYLANTAVVPALPAQLNLSQIMLQKYIAMYGYGIDETWTDLRRYHYTDLEPGTIRQVYDQFTPPFPNELYVNNNEKLVYRKRPRYNSEYLYNIEALESIGALELDYHTKEMWFSQP